MEDKHAGGFRSSSHHMDDVDKPVRIPTLPTFPNAGQLDGTNYALWKVAMAVVLESYD